MSSRGRRSSARGETGHVLIVDDELDRSSVVAARELARDGWAVDSASSQDNLASLSRAVSRWHQLPQPHEREDAFVQTLAELVDRHGYAVVLTSSDQAAEVLSRRRAEIPAVIPWGPHDGVVELLDKLRLVAAAQRVGIETPRVSDADGAKAPGWSGPAIVKSRRRVGEGHGTYLCATPEEIDAAVATILDAGGDPLVQEVVEGVLEGVAVVLDRDGEPVSLSYQVTEGVWPDPAGPTVRARTLAVSDGPIDETLALLRSVGWLGLAHLQYLRTESGRRVLIDVNPRCYGSIALAARAGAHHASQWARVALGLPAGMQVAVPGKTYQWFSRDLRHRVAQRGLVRGSLGAVRHAPGAAHSIWSPLEPAYAGRYVRRRLSRRHTPPLKSELVLADSSG